MPSPSQLAPIPEYLLPYIVQQDERLYTAIDHACWRFILKIAQDFFARHAHQKYLDGLRETGISTDRIPLVSEMDAKLRSFGWRAVAVSGFIPPAVFLEFLSLGIMPIACDMRKLEHIAYTPAPDIVHEAAGHAPIVADPDYAKYLRHYGEIARKVIFSDQDMEVYRAIRALSDIKEDPGSTAERIEAAQKTLDDANARVTYVSEATQLTRMGWWTTEYGLIGDPAQPKIYGAGLLSSVSESYHCFGPNVRRIPFSVDCVHQAFDITKPQPQLFVARDFEELSRGLETLANTMAFRRGGNYGLGIAKLARTVTTAELDSGIQISGVLEDYFCDSAGTPCFLKFNGPSQLAYEDREFPGQGASYHKEGYSTPIGRLKRWPEKSPGDLTDTELLQLGFRDGQAGLMEFASGIAVAGKLRTQVRKDGKLVVLAFADCTVSRGAEILFRPEWGTFDLACGDRVVSVFGQAADRAHYLAVTGGYHQDAGHPKTNLTDDNRALCELYTRVRKLRDWKSDGADELRELTGIHAELDAKHADDWLLRYELLELNAARGLQASWEKSVRARLAEITAKFPDKGEMIARGLELLS